MAPSLRRYLTTAALGLLLLFVPAALAVASLAYTGAWSFQLNCAWHDSCAGVHPDFVRLHGENLSAFYRHQGLLTGAWTEKEVGHLTEVRGMLDGMLVALLLMVPMLIGLWQWQRVRRAASINLLLIAAALLTLPFFGAFWSQVFHPLLFDNLLWKNTPMDASWYVMPRVYFRSATAYTLLWLLLINAAALLLSRRQKRRQGSEEG